MVLQRESTIKIWGWAAPNEKISLSFINHQKSAIANNKGEWEIVLSDLKPGGPYTINLKASNAIRIENVMVGDVWICGGQSNMELPMGRVSPLYESEIEKANNPSIRYFYVPRKYDFNIAQNDFENGEWQPISQENILSISAVAYFFAKEIHEKYNIPIGLINNALGGSPAEAWINEDALKKFPDYYKEAQQFKDEEYLGQIQKNDTDRQNSWYETAYNNDEGYKIKPWYADELNTEGWQKMNIPGYWADSELGDINGVVWFRKEIDVPASMAGKPAKLLLGRVVDADSTYVNGVFVGTVSYQYPPRRYDVPENILKKGKNTITVRVINNRGHGGFFLDKPYELIIDEKIIDLKGEWKYKLGVKMPELASQTFIRWKPLGLYNAMLHPIFNYGIKGVIWYQGESNTKNPKEYENLFPALIENWRNGFSQGDFPFLFVQLANFMRIEEIPMESNWAELREAQRKTLNIVTNTAMAVAIDIGEWNDIHPLNKEDVGKRLALGAQKLAYGDENVIYSGPLFESMKIKGKKAILSFSNTGSGLMTKNNEKLNHFSIAGKNGEYVWATAKIKGNKVIVCNKQLENPISVRYAWAHNPLGANLYNKEGLPASPFQADIK